MRVTGRPAYGRVEAQTLDQEAIPMHKLISLAFVLVAAGALAAWANAGTGRHHPGHTSGSSIASIASIAAIADSSTSWAEFSSKVPNLQDLTRASR
jgi:hypothetical protein